jgi:hypothetical protein
VFHIAVDVECNMFSRRRASFIFLLPAGIYPGFYRTSGLFSFSVAPFLRNKKTECIVLIHFQQVADVGPVNT